MPFLRPFEVRLSGRNSSDRGRLRPCGGGAARQWRHLMPSLVMLAASLLPAGAGLAQEDPLKWLPPGSTVQTTLSERPARWIRAEMQGGTMGYMARLGELAFRSPLTLGREAARRGLSCDACHPNGAANVRFFVPGASDRPGNVDVTHLEFHFREDDGIDNPVNIPSLRGVRLTAPYGHDGRVASLRDFSRHVIMNEFGGPEIEPWLLDALVAYQQQLALPPRPGTTDEAAAGRDAYGDHCAACHGDVDALPPPARHDIGTGGFFEPPAVFGLAETAPYLHDGSAPTLRAAVAAHRDPPPAEALEPILAWLQAAGAVTRRFDPETPAGDLARLLGFLAVLNQPLLDEDFVRADRIADMVAMEVGRVHRRYRPEATEARDATRSWAKDLKQVTALAAARRFPEARAALAALGEAMQAALPRLEAARELSLYAATAAD